ncbi:MAG: hypothetical protein DI582_09065, partial [Azospirillum brasilense]
MPSMQPSPAVAKNEPQESSSQIVSKPVSAYDKQSRMGLAVKWFRHKVGRRGENSIKNILEEAL